MRNKFRGHFLFTAVAMLGGGFYALRGTLGGQSTDSAGLVAAGIVGFAAAGHLLLMFCEPITFSRGRVCALLLVLIAPLCLLLPKLMRPADGWPVNLGSDAAREDESIIGSRVVAPGDDVWVSWTPDNLESVDGLWSGKPTVQVLNARKVGCQNMLSGTGNDDSWGNWIWTGGAVSSYAPRVWTKFTIPDNPRLAGKTLHVHIKLRVLYPAQIDGTTFDDKSRTLVRRTSIQVASREVKQAYWWSWSVALFVGLGGSAAGGFMLIASVFSPGRHTHRSAATLTTSVG